MAVFKIGDIVTLKSHPLFSYVPKRIMEFPAHVPPLMLIKEVLYEKEDKKNLYSDVIEKAQIADVVKYVCVFFNANKSEFVEKTIYNSLIKSYLELKYYRKDESKSKSLTVDLISEVLNYKSNFNYEFGKRVQFKTKKLEHRKSYDGHVLEKTPGPSFQSPDFILSGIKNEEQKDLFYTDGKPKRIISDQSFKVMWFNHLQQKFSEEYLPKEFFVEGLEL
ncbi:hypothetical protein ACFFU1_17185 [Algibacter miyuki]|uniref:Uncharacterized protein n=1 Tax=Algibacter miyuki TaxID=1306933 RepID=A0ABV5H466_9FLAO|nr:hypothetical protein [Algibacter miyuki]MDN3665713.1 hypothetical protein [Algibacter miyuki]